MFIYIVLILCETNLCSDTLSIIMLHMNFCCCGIYNYYTALIYYRPVYLLICSLCSFTYLFTLLGISPARGHIEYLCFVIV
jgi:hypothetical protein